MDFLFLVLRKCLVGVITLVFAFAVTYIPQHYNRVSVVEAQVLVKDPIVITTLLSEGAIQTPLLSTTAIADAVNTEKEIGLDTIGFMLAKTMISHILKSMVTWINSGFKGSPAFITDLDKFLLDAADEAAGEYIKSLGEVGSFICEPFRLDIQIALKLKYTQAKNGNKDRCNLSEIVDNVETFFENETKQENFWQKWVEITANPKDYTPYGQFMEAEANLNAKMVNAKGRELELAKMGDGFLSGKVCEAVGGSNASKTKCTVTKPGRVIADQLNKTLGAGQDQLVAADELNEVISALLGQIAVQAVTGAAGLLGLSTNNSGLGQTDASGNSYVDNLVEESQMNKDFLADGITGLEKKLATQEDYNSLAIQYIPLLFAVKNAPLTADSVRSQAILAHDDAVQVQQTTDEHIRKLRPLVLEYRTLEREYTTATTTRQREIRTRQSAIISTGGTYRAYTEDRLNMSRREWKEITGQ